MKNLVLVIFAVQLCVVGVTSQSNNSTDVAIRKALTDYDNAWNKKDLEAVGRIVTDDYVYFNSLGGLTDRKATLQFLVSAEYKLTFVERSEIKLLSSSTDVAVISSRWKGKGSFGNEPIDDDQRCGLVFVRRKNLWRLLSEHCTQIVTK